jgi:EmrB/QacA subfamily drug resistance transporter
MHGHGPSGHHGSPLVVPLDVHRRRWAILAVLATSLLITAIDHTIINVALPRMVAELDATTSQLQWIVDAYTVVFAGLLLTTGALGDRFGRRGALQLGLAVFLGGSLLAATSATAGGVIAARAVMGVGGALIMPATLSILTTSFADPRERAKAIGAWAGVAGVGVALGPIAGGYLLDHFAWSSVFWVNVPFIVVALMAGRLLLPTSRAGDRRPLDLVGSALSIAALAALVYAVIEAPDHGWTSGSSLSWFTGAATLLAAFIAWELHHPEPMLDMRFFADRRFTAASASITFAFFAMAGAVFLVTQYLQFVLGYTPLRAGVGILPAALALFVAGPASAAVAGRIGARPTVAIGLGLAAAGLAGQALLVDGSGYLPVGIGQMLLGLGLGLTMAPATESIMASLPPERAGVGSAVNDTTREVGSALGVAIVGSAAAGVFGNEVAARIGSLDLSAGAMAAAGDNVGAAHEVAAALDPVTGGQLAGIASDAFVDALHAGLWVAATVAFAGAAVAALGLPSRRTTAKTTAKTHDLTTSAPLPTDLTDPADHEPVRTHA